MTVVTHGLDNAITRDIYQLTTLRCFLMSLIEKEQQRNYESSLNLNASIEDDIETSTCFCNALLKIYAIISFK